MVQLAHIVSPFDSLENRLNYAIPSKLCPILGGTPLLPVRKTQLRGYNFVQDHTEEPRVEYESSNFKSWVQPTTWLYPSPLQLHGQFREVNDK